MFPQILEDLIYDQYWTLCIVFLIEIAGDSRDEEKSEVMFTVDGRKTPSDYDVMRRNRDHYHLY